MWVQNFVGNSKGHLWNFTHDLEPMHCRICILLIFCVWFTHKNWIVTSQALDGPLKCMDEINQTPKSKHVHNFAGVLYVCISFMAYMTSWKGFPHYWPFVKGIHWSPMDSPNKERTSNAIVYVFFGVNSDNLPNKNRDTWLVIDFVVEFSASEYQ